MAKLTTLELAEQELERTSRNFIEAKRLLEVEKEKVAEKKRRLKAIEEERLRVVAAQAREARRLAYQDPFQVMVGKTVTDVYYDDDQAGVLTVYFGDIKLVCSTNGDGYESLCVEIENHVPPVVTPEEQEIDFG